MRLLIITAVKAYENQIKEILKNSEISSFSYTEVAGVSKKCTVPMTGNWFANDKLENESLLFYVFVKKENAEQVFEKVDKVNILEPSRSKIHVAMVNIEKMNEA